VVRSCDEEVKIWRFDVGIWRCDEVEGTWGLGEVAVIVSRGERFVLGGLSDSFHGSMGTGILSGWSDIDDFDPWILWCDVGEVSGKNTTGGGRRVGSSWMSGETVDDDNPQSVLNETQGNVKSDGWSDPGSGERRRGDVWNWREVGEGDRGLERALGMER